MSTGRQLAFAKLTRTLRVTGRRSDGYHLIESEMLTLDFADELEFADAPASELTIVDEIAWVGGPVDHDALAHESPSIPADGTNLVLRALARVGRPATTTLRKRIPAGAGLGGGSADAAAALRFAGVNDPLVALQLGADVPFCLEGGRCLARGVGEILEPLEFVPLSFVVVTPAFGVSTAAAYAAFDELGAGPGANDLERGAIAVEPRLARIKSLLRDAAGREPVLAGSGSSYFLECSSNAAATLRSEIVKAVRAEGVVASVVACASTGTVRSVTSST